MSKQYSARSLLRVQSIYIINIFITAPAKQQYPDVFLTITQKKIQIRYENFTRSEPAKQDKTV